MEGSFVIFGDSRSMPELESESVELVVTSPPYFHIKDYGEQRQIGFGQTLHQYFRDLYLVWQECRRVLRPGGRLCISIGDQFARARDFGRYKVIPLHAEIILQCEKLRLDYLGAVVWQKKTTLRPSGGAVIMGSFPYPPNGIVELDYEFILIFKKPGGSSETRRRKREAKQRGLLRKAALSRSEWKSFFSGHWRFAGARKKGHEAPFPLELPWRLIRMFTFPHETVLDPFLGSGTTARAALGLKRRFVGYEICGDYRKQIEKKLGSFCSQVSFKVRECEVPVEPSEYEPALPDMAPQQVTEPAPPAPLLRVRQVLGPMQLGADNGKQIVLRGLKVPESLAKKAEKYLKDYLLGKSVYLRGESTDGHSRVRAYVYLSNRLFVNRKMIEMGLALPSQEEHPLRDRFFEAYTKLKKKGC